MPFPRIAKQLGYVFPTNIDLFQSAQLQQSQLLKSLFETHTWFRHDVHFFYSMRIRGMPTLTFSRKMYTWFSNFFYHPYQPTSFLPFHWEKPGDLKFAWRHHGRKSGGQGKSGRQARGWTAPNGWTGDRKLRDWRNRHADFRFRWDPTAKKVTLLTGKISFSIISSKHCKLISGFLCKFYKVLPNLNKMMIKNAWKVLFIFLWLKAPWNLLIVINFYEWLKANKSNFMRKFKSLIREAIIASRAIELRNWVV